MDEKGQSDDCEITKTVSPNDAIDSNGAGAPLSKRKSATMYPDAEKKKPTRQPRKIVDSVHLSTLISSYNVHFVAYSEGHTKVTQMIPNAVWKLMYQDYIKAFPNNTLKEFNLKDRVRETLAEIETGNSNEKNSETAALQSSSILEDLKLTNGHAKRNILSHRTKIMETTAKKIPSPLVPTATKNESDGSHSSSVEIRKTKHTMLSEQVDAITSISESLQSSAATKEKLAVAKLNHMELKNLKELRDFSVITTDEFCIRAHDLFRM